MPDLSEVRLLRATALIATALLLGACEAAVVRLVQEGVSIARGDRAGDPKQVFRDPKVVALSDAARRGDTAIVQRLLAEGVSPNVIGDDGVTPLSFALLARSTDPARLLLEAGADPNVANASGVVLLYYALMKDDTAHLEVLLDHGADPNATMRNGSVLQSALMNGKLPALEMLLARGADPDGKDHSGTPLLHTCLDIHDAAAATALLKAGADPRAEDKGKKSFLERMCEKASLYLRDQKGRNYTEYMALWQELVRRDHTPPCAQPF